MKNFTKKTKYFLIVIVSILVSLWIIIFLYKYNIYLGRYPTSKQGPPTLEQIINEEKPQKEPVKYIRVKSSLIPFSIEMPDIWGSREEESEEMYVRGFSIMNKKKMLLYKAEIATYCPVPDIL